MALHKLKIDNGTEFYEFYTTAKKWCMLPSDEKYKLYDTIALETESEPRWKDFPVFRTITHIQKLDDDTIIASLK